MINQETKDKINYYVALPKETLLKVIAELEFEAKALGEMAESARLGYAPHGPTESECEQRIEEIESYLNVARMFTK